MRLEALGSCDGAYLKAFRTIPRTLCNDDMLPFKVLGSGNHRIESIP